MAHLFFQKAWHIWHVIYGLSYIYLLEFCIIKNQKIAIANSFILNSFNCNPLLW